jgi:hypothetical protein
MEVSNSNSPKNTRTQIPAGGILVFYTDYEHQYVYVCHPKPPTHQPTTTTTQIEYSVYCKIYVDEKYTTPCTGTAA